MKRSADCRIGKSKISKEIDLDENDSEAEMNLTAFFEREVDETVDEGFPLAVDNAWLYGSSDRYREEEAAIAHDEVTNSTAKGSQNGSGTSPHTSEKTSRAAQLDQSQSAAPTAASTTHPLNPTTQVQIQSQEPNIPILMSPYPAVAFQNVAQNSPSMGNMALFMNQNLQQAIYLQAASNLYASLRMQAPTLITIPVSYPVMAQQLHNNLYIASAGNVRPNQLPVSLLQSQQDPGTARNPTLPTVTPFVALPATIAPVAALPAQPTLTHRSAVPLYLDYDDEHLNEYQCLLRKQIEVFETKQEDVEGSAQGRNTPIRIGQCGIRCRHCSVLPKSIRPKGSQYYSKTLEGVYQIAQNMARVHFGDTCSQIPPSTRERLLSLHKSNKRASGGKRYWVDGLRAHGLEEIGDGRGIRFRALELGSRGF